ncbi:hypothetical protein CMI37_18420 [Candidatus Pacearchaeota archaeon]|nr:hypothetical protein [Candidatus Pacearchaeota archaeon]
MRNFLKAIKEYGCIEVRNTPHGVIIENPKNAKSTNIPTHRPELAIWIYHNILRQLDIDKKDFEKLF